MGTSITDISDSEHIQSYGNVGTRDKKLSQRIDCCIPDTDIILLRNEIIYIKNQCAGKTKIDALIFFNISQYDQNITDSI